MKIMPDRCSSCKNIKEERKSANEYIVKCKLGAFKRTDDYIISIDGYPKVVHKDCPLIGKVKCPECGGKTIMREGKYGLFIGCGNFPDCRWSTGVGDVKDFTIRESIIKKIKSRRKVQQGRWSNMGHQEAKNYPVGESTLLGHTPGSA